MRPNRSGHESSHHACRLCHRSRINLGFRDGSENFSEDCACCGQRETRLGMSRREDELELGKLYGDCVAFLLPSRARAERQSHPMATKEASGRTGAERAQKRAHVRNCWAGLEQATPDARWTELFQMFQLQRQRQPSQRLGPPTVAPLAQALFTSKFFLQNRNSITFVCI